MLKCLFFSLSVLWMLRINRVIQTDNLTLLNNKECWENIRGVSFLTCTLFRLNSPFSLEYASFFISISFYRNHSCKFHISNNNIYYISTSRSYINKSYLQDKYEERTTLSIVNEKCLLYVYVDIQILCVLRYGVRTC